MIHAQNMAMLQLVSLINCDFIIRSHLQLINTLIDTFFSKRHTFLTKQGRKRYANDG